MQMFLITFILLTALAQTGNGLQCWECSEALQNGSACQDPFTSEVSKTTCPPGHDCMKLVTAKTFNVDVEVEVPLNVTRGCGTDAMCLSSLNDILGICSLCTSDLCNSSGVAVPSLITVGALLIAAKLN